MVGGGFGSGSVLYVAAALLGSWESNVWAASIIVSKQIPWRSSGLCSHPCCCLVGLEEDKEEEEREEKGTEEKEEGPEEGKDETRIFFNNNFLQLAEGDKVQQISAKHFRYIFCNNPKFHSL